MPEISEKRRNARHGEKSQSEHINLTTDEARQIIQSLAETEFTLVYSTLIEFAMVETYGIPTIS